MSAAPELRVLQRVVFPTGENLDVVPLYVETDVDRGGAMVSDVDGEHTSAAATAAVGVHQASVRFGAALEPDGDPAARRRSAVVRAGSRASFATYFNAFPAGYWHRWSTVDGVTLRIELAGTGSLIVYRSSAKGHSHPVRTVPFDHDLPRVLEIALPLTQFVDGGWYWFDIAAGSREVRLVCADWLGEAPRRERGRFSIGITTFNRPDFCLDQLRVLGAATELRELLDTIHVIDQGTDRIVDHPEFADATKQLGDQLHLVHQRNLGGSGGFSRAMADTVAAGGSDYILLLDDDVVLEPEGVLRALTFAELARDPMIVGGHMFSLYDRSVLHAFGETIAPFPWWWGAAAHTSQRHDFGRRNLRNTPWLHRRVDVDYNGWWMCLIPTELVREVGLAMPFFIKWDDAEYGVRARAAGYHTVSMPGVAVWHVPWDDKNDALDWQSYYHLRNRLVTALLHSPFARGGRVVGASIETQLQHLLSMQYSTAALRLAAIEDVLAGPDHLHRTLPDRLSELRLAQRALPDGQYAEDIAAYPEPRRRRPPRRADGPKPPGGRAGLMVKAARAVLHQDASMKPPERPDAVVAHQDAQWWLLSQLDSAVVSAADGSGAAWYQRDPARWRELSARSLALHSRLLVAWPSLRTQYRASAADVVSVSAWHDSFADPDRPAPPR